MMGVKLSAYARNTAQYTGPQRTFDRVVQRQRIALFHQDDVESRAIATYLGCSLSTVYRWRKPLDRGFEDRVRAGRPKKFGKDAALRVIGLFCQSEPAVKTGQWSLRWMEQYLKNHPNLLGVSPSRSEIHRMLSSHRLHPHQQKYFLHISDPNFFPKMEQIIELYQTRPQHLYCYDECPGIQVLQRLAPSILSHMTETQQRKWLTEFEYIRHGTMDVLAFLEVHTGKVSCQCRKDHTKKTILHVFEDHVNALPFSQKEQVHFIMDNLAAHYSWEMCELVASLSGVEYPDRKQLYTADQRRGWLQRADKRIVVCFTPFHGSWLNLIEIWFGILGQHVLKGSFASPHQLHQAIMCFAEFWNQELAHGFNWKYDGHGLHDKAVSRLIRMLQFRCSDIPMRFLLKQLKLMINLLQAYRNMVSNDLWSQLLHAITKNMAILNQVIKEDDKPKRKQQTSVALASLVEHLENACSKKVEQLA